MFVINIGNFKKKTEISYFFKKTLSHFTVYSKCGCEYKKIFIEEWSIEILKNLHLINNMQEYQKIYNHAWQKHESRI